MGSKCLAIIFKNVFTKLLLLLLITLNLSLNAQVINTLAGFDYLGNGKKATLAILKTPGGLALDKQGNIYFADINHSTIRKVNIKSGIIDNYAGDGEFSSTGDGFLATNASLYGPLVFRFDSVGNGYFLDSKSTIRKVSNSTGIITTIVGIGQTEPDTVTKEGPALKATFSNPRDFVLDKQGNIFILDRGTSTIRKVSVSSGIISVIAGNGKTGYAGDGSLASNAVFSRPTAISIDDSSNLYIIDNGNYRIRKISSLTGIISTIVGDGTSGNLTGDTVLANTAKISNNNYLHVDKLGNIYFDMQGGVIKKVEKSSNLMYTIIGSGNTGFSGDSGLAINAKISNPRSITTDAQGNIYIADNNRIRKIDISNSNIYTIAGVGNYTGDNLNYNGTATTAQLNNPQGIALSREGDVYVADNGNNRIRKISVFTSQIKNIIGNGDNGFSLIGNTSLTQNNNVNIPLSSPTNVLVDTAKGNLYLYSIPSILKYTQSVNMLSWIGGGQSNLGYTEGAAATGADISINSNISIDKDGNIYTVETNRHTIRKITISTGKINTVVNNSRIAGFSGDGGAAVSAKISSPICVALDNLNNMYIGEGANYRIRKVNTTTGIITTIAGTGVSGFSGDNGLATNAQIGTPLSIAIDNANNIIFNDGGIRIRKINASDGIITTIAGSGKFAKFVENENAKEAYISANKLAVDKSGNIFYTESGTNAVRVIYNTPNVNMIVENQSQLDTFNACVGKPSSIKEFYVLGNLLVDSLKITTSQNFQVSLTENGTYSNSIALPATNGSVSPTKVFARSIVKTVIGNFGGQIYVSSKNAYQKETSVFGTVGSVPSTPSITLTGPTRICKGQTVVLKSDIIDGNQWYLNNQPIIRANDTVYKPDITGDYTAAKVINGCASEQSSKITVTVDDYPSSPIVNDTSYCLNDISDYLKATASSNNTLIWYGSNQTGSVGSATSIKPVTSIVGPSNYYVSQKTNISSCESEKSKIVVTIKPLPVAPIIKRDSLGNLVSNFINGNIWYKDQVLIKDTNQVLKPGGNGSYTIKIFKDGCANVSIPYYFLVTDVINLSTDEFIKLAPNPFINQLNFDFVVKGYQKLNIEAFDMATGSKKASMQNLTPGMPINLSQLSAGTYIIKVSSNDGKINYQFKMIKL